MPTLASLDSKQCGPCLPLTCELQFKQKFLYLCELSVKHKHGSSHSEAWRQKDTVSFGPINLKMRYERNQIIFSR